VSRAAAVDRKRRAAGPRASRLVAGIDEAGLGPLLGPLAIGWSVLRLPEPGADPWKLLRRTVHKRPTRRARLVVADSKRVFSRNALGWRRLEATALTFLALLQEGGRPPADARALFTGAVPPRPGGLDAPWYDRLPRLPRVHEEAGIELGAALLARRMRARDLALVDAGVRLVPASELNASYRETDNKGATVWERCREVIRHVWTRHGEEAPDLTVDLLGGRMHYGGLLSEAFPEAQVSRLFEGQEHSAYVLDEDGASADASWLPRRMRIDFRAKGEDASFAVALASCLAKYAREVVMTGFNDYFHAHAPELEPTAGYTTDGRRWLEDARSAIASCGVADDVLVRTR
jgi:hypothetical protein